MRLDQSPVEVEVVNELVSHQETLLAKFDRILVEPAVQIWVKLIWSNSKNNVVLTGAGKEKSLVEKFRSSLKTVDDFA